MKLLSEKRWFFDWSAMFYMSTPSLTWRLHNRRCITGVLLKLNSFLHGQCVRSRQFASRLTTFHRLVLMTNISLNIPNIVLRLEHMKRPEDITPVVLCRLWAVNWNPFYQSTLPAIVFIKHTFCSHHDENNQMYRT